MSEATNSVQCDCGRTIGSDKAALPVCERCAYECLVEATAELTALRQRLGAATAALTVAQDEAKRLREAGNVLLMVSLPPNDVSGSRMWNEAAEIIRNPQPSEAPHG